MSAMSTILSRLGSGRLRVWLIWLWALLTPAVLVVGIQTKLRHFRASEFSIDVGRPLLIERARQFLQQNGVTPPSKDPQIRIVRERRYQDYLHHLVQQESPALRIAELPLPAAHFVLDFDDAGDNPINVSFAPDGRIVGYSLGEPSPSLFVPDDARRAAIRLAEARLGDVLRYPERYQLSVPRVYEQTAKWGRPEYRVEWTAVNRNAPEVAFTVRFGIAGERVFSQELDADIDTDLAPPGFATAFRNALMIIAPFYLLALVLWLLTRYLQRSLEGEVSHGRALVVTIYLAGIMTVIFISGDAQLLMNIQLNGADSILVWALLAVVCGVVALLAGACYAAGEGDVRERYPRALTSFDALLLGRFFSRNVAWSFLVGAAVACWLFAFQVFVNLRFEQGVEEPGSIISVYRLVVSEIPYIHVFLILPVGVGLVMLMGFLAPLSVVARFPGRSSITWSMFAAMSFLNLMILHGGHSTPWGLFLTIGSEAATLLVLIVAADLLSAYVCLVISGYLVLLTNAQLLTSMPSHVQWWMHGVVFATAGLCLYLLKKGETLSDDDVKPAYARALAERQSLSRQISIAALAQQSLMVKTFPEMAGYSLAVECKAARAVSGDYFDWYRLNEHQLGIVLISGAGRGLLDAMVIAYAKGFLQDRSSRDGEPVETLADLLDSLTAVLEGEDRFPEICYLILDSREGYAVYARTPGFPEPIRVRNREGQLPSVKSGGKVDEEVRKSFQGGRFLRLDNGIIPLDADTTLLVFTNGFASSLYLAGVFEVREWLRQTWSRLRADSARGVLNHLGAAVFRDAKDWQRINPKEDVTVVVAQFAGVVVEAAPSSKQAEGAS